MSTGLLDSQIEKLLSNDKMLMEQTKFPIVTVSSSFREDLKQFYGMVHDPEMRDVVFSRAHFSMAMGVLIQAWQNAKPLPPLGKALGAKEELVYAKTAWLSDPTNFVQSSDWSKIQGVEYVGRKLARNSVLKWIKDHIDTIVRNRLPITAAITPPLLHLFQQVDQPIISLHYEAGNILASLGRRVVQVVTDPHVREQYLTYANLKNIKFCVFDEKTKEDFLEKAELLDKEINPDRVIVTGPPIDPRIVAARTKKSPTHLRKRPLRVCITTGGLGTNKEEIRAILHEIFDLLRKRPVPIQLLGYGGTNHDFTVMVEQVAKEERVKISPLEDDQAPFRFIHGKHIVEINEHLIQYGFSWADTFIAKPSGDMAYDAAAAGCSLLFLRPWGEWEENIREVFEQRGVGRQAQIQHIKAQLAVLMEPAGSSRKKSWFEEAQLRALQLPPLFTSGSMQILSVAADWR